MNILIRFSLTAIVVLWALFPHLNHTTSQSVLGEILSIGIAGSLTIIIAFFTMVAFYCRTLEECLSLIHPNNRKAKPKSVWLMFAIPFNFIEDFFIVINIARSIEEEKRTNHLLSTINDFGMISGIGWSIAQLLSFIPSIIGQIAGLLGMILVVYHWFQIARINRLLKMTQND